MFGDGALLEVEDRDHELPGGECRRKAGRSDEVRAGASAAALARGMMLTAAWLAKHPNPIATPDCSAP